MSLKYQLIQKVNPQKTDAPRKFYATAVKKNEITLRQLAKEIAQISTVSTIDTIAMIESLIQLIPKHLMQGNVVRLGDFGSYSISIKSEGIENNDQFHSNLIKGVKINFRPGKELKNAFNNVEFEKEQ
jgi:predicted histone-like DNA-binding protein